jgi:hypothetical protein
MFMELRHRTARLPQETFFGNPSVADATSRGLLVESDHVWFSSVPEMRHGHAALPFSASGIRSAMRHFNALANFSTVAIVKFRWPRSTMLTNVQCRPASAASFSWDNSLAVRNCRIATVRSEGGKLKISLGAPDLLRACGRSGMLSMNAAPTRAE